MTLAAGTKLGPYEVLSPLGAGGMGEVYRAKDTKLHREVAIKVLPESLSADPERLARFEREARVLASLNHPHIASIYGMEESTSVKALVLELVEGQTLQDRIEAGPIPVDEALSIGKQIAEALEVAHEKGIVHRDLKPANVKIDPEGQVKVLDFGLAKALDPLASTSSPDISHSPTMSLGTQAGMILGTAAYMSPEQARGKAIDRRADIWAFGVVLYEMLTGQRLFAGETVSDTLAAVLRHEISFDALPPATPPSVRSLLARCLDRDPKNRLRDIGEARIALEVAGHATPQQSPAAVAAPPASGRRSRAVAIGAAAFALALGLAAGWLLRRPAALASGAGARWALAIPDGFSLVGESSPNLAISADGRLQAAVVVDSARTTHLLVRSMDEIEPRILADTEGATSPFFSPDGKWIGFFRNQTLLKIPSSGGPPIDLAATATVTAARGATWSRDGFIYFAPNVAVGLSRVSQNGGPVTAVTKLDLARDERTHRWPQALPDGSAVLFTCDTAASTEYYDDARIEAVRPSTGERKVVVEGSSQARYGSGGRLIFARGGSLFAIAFDARTLSTRGAPEIVAQGIATDVSSGAVQFAVSRQRSGDLGARRRERSVPAFLDRPERRRDADPDFPRSLQRVGPFARRQTCRADGRQGWRRGPLGRGSRARHADPPHGRRRHYESRLDARRRSRRLHGSRARTGGPPVAARVEAGGWQSGCGNPAGKRPAVGAERLHARRPQASLQQRQGRSRDLGERHFRHLSASRDGRPKAGAAAPRHLCQARRRRLAGRPLARLLLERGRTE